MNKGDILRCRLKAPERIFDFGSRTFIDKKAPDSFRKMIFANIKREFAYKLTERILFKEIEQNQQLQTELNNFVHIDKGDIFDEYFGK